MYIPSATRPVAADTGATSNNSTTSATDGQDMFMQLLVTQLKNQSPIDPVDPNQFVGQLVQFNTLDQIIGIRQILDQLNGQSTSTTGTKH